MKVIIIILVPKKKKKHIILKESLSYFEGILWVRRRISITILINREIQTNHQIFITLKNIYKDIISMKMDTKKKMLKIFYITNTTK